MLAASKIKILYPRSCALRPAAIPEGPPPIIIISYILELLLSSRFELRIS
jgi:hypothetical protein